jgi:hypothetical protein
MTNAHRGPVAGLHTAKEKIMSKKPTLRSYEVTVFTWSADTTVVKACGEETACELAEELWGEDDTAFRHRDGGINDIDAEEVSR